MEIVLHQLFLSLAVLLLSSINVQYLHIVVVFARNDRRDGVGALRLVSIVLYGRGGRFIHHLLSAPEIVGEGVADTGDEKIPTGTRLHHSLTQGVFRAAIGDAALPLVSVRDDDLERLHLHPVEESLLGAAHLQRARVGLTIVLCRVTVLCVTPYLTLFLPCSNDNRWGLDPKHL